MSITNTGFGENAGPCTTPNTGISENAGPCTTPNTGISENAGPCTTTTTTEKLDQLVRSCREDRNFLVWISFRNRNVYFRSAGVLTKVPEGYRLDCCTVPTDLILKEVIFAEDAAVEVQNGMIYLNSF